MCSSDLLNRRVVITGVGLISPLGNHPDTLREALFARRSGVAALQRIPADYLPSAFGAEAREFTGDIEQFGPLEKTLQRNIKKGIKLMCREIQMGVAAAQLCLTDAGLSPDRRSSERTGVTYGSDHIMTIPEEFTDGIRNCLNAEGKFEFSRWGKDGLPKVDPMWLLRYLPNMPASHIAIYNDLRGPSNSITLREPSSNLAVAESASTIQRDSADAMIAGATGTRIHALRTIHVCLQEEIARGAEGDKLSRPFDADRNGSVLGEGAGVEVDMAPLERDRFTPANAGRGHKPDDRRGRGPDPDEAALRLLELGLLAGVLRVRVAGHALDGRV